MKTIKTMLALAVLAVTLFGFNVQAQTITIGGNQYAFQYNSNTNYGMYFNLTAARYELRNGTGTSVFSVNANTGQVISQGIQNTGNISNTGNIQFGASGDLLIGANRYAFRYSAGSNYGLFFNATQTQYEFRNGSAVSVFAVNANTGNAVLAAGLQIGNSSLANAGNIRWNGTDFQGYNGTAWVSLTSGSGGPGLPAGTAGQTLRHDGTNWVANDNIWNTGSNVGVGTSAAPTARFQVDGNAASTQRVIQAINNYSGTSDVRAVYGSSVPADGYGYGGEFIGGWYGVAGTASGGAYTGSGFGVRGSAAGTAGTRYGGYFTATSSGPTTNYGVYGAASGATTNWAGYFVGNVYSSGNTGLGTLTPDNRLSVSGSANVTGNVGIGIAAPIYDLQIEATTTRGIYVNQNNTTGTTYGVFANVDNAGTNTKYGLRSYVGGGTGTRYGVSTSVYADAANSSTVYGVYSFVSGTATTGTSYAGYFSGSGTTGTTWATYAVGDSYVSGDLKVGTTSGATGYKLSVNGKIACSELLIDNPSSWPDYVFADDYNLRSIEELESSINENKHLPGMPSAKEIEDNGGFHIGDIQKRTLEKVEELSLYIIELNNRLKALEAENASLKANTNNN